MRRFIDRLLDQFPFVRRHKLTTAFLAGFVVDLLTLNNIEQRFDQAVLTIYVLIAFLSIWAHYAAIAERFSERLSLRVRRFAPGFTQYAFGGLLSGMLIFYGRSGSFADSWPFVFIILFAIFANETIKNREHRLVYNLTIFFIGIFSYVVLMVPVFLGRMGDLVFVGSGMLALLLMYWFVHLLMKVVPNFMTLQKRAVVFTVGLSFVMLNALYFLNVIPPIPLALKDVGIYHSVVHFPLENKYVLRYEKPKWWRWYADSDKDFYFQAGDVVYCFASVYAPALITVPIFHRWEYYNTETKDWVKHARIPYVIYGQRAEGYRGYTNIQNYREGKWRCIVETERGQVLGREAFTITAGEGRPLVTVEK